ncbi:MAG: superoxide dismutase [Flavobacteriales bacterium]|nr:superoxide dismutase [Flavobacteriales bacterium]
MKKREFLKLTGIVSAGVVVSPFISCDSPPPPPPPVSKDDGGSAGSAPLTFELPELGYAYDALAPAIDAQTMEIHHSKHHAGYVKKLNKALGETDGFGGMELPEILAHVSEDQKGVRNNAGGHWNHSLYWEIMAPGGGSAPQGPLADAINSAFGDMDAFSEKFFTAAKTRFGSGWAWLAVDRDKKLFVSSTPNQDNPMMEKIAERSGTPILGIDVWEHAYYLNYQNRRGDYINAFMETINWDTVSANFAAHC